MRNIRRVLATTFICAMQSGCEDFSAKTSGVAMRWHQGVVCKISSAFQQVGYSQAMCLEVQGEAGLSYGGDDIAVSLSREADSRHGAEVSVMRAVHQLKHGDVDSGGICHYSDAQIEAECLTRSYPTLQDQAVCLQNMVDTMQVRCVEMVSGAGSKVVAGKNDADQSAGKTGYRSSFLPL